MIIMSITPVETHSGPLNVCTANFHGDSLQDLDKSDDHSKFCHQIIRHRSSSLAIHVHILLNLVRNFELQLFSL